MFNRDDARMAMGIGALVATIISTTCSTNGRFDDVNRRIDDANQSVNKRIDDVNNRISDTNELIRNLTRRVDDLHQLLAGSEPPAAANGPQRGE